jgi:hypothetical protein
MISTAEIERIADEAREYVAKKSETLGPTVIASALVTHTARYLQQHVNTRLHPELDRAVNELNRIGEELWTWRP